MENPNRKFAAGVVIMAALALQGVQGLHSAYAEPPAAGDVRPDRNAAEAPPPRPDGPREPGERRPDNRDQGGDRRPPGPPPGPREIEQLGLTDEQLQSVDPIVKAFHEKQHAVREEFLKQMKGVLTPGQYAALEKEMTRPPGPPPLREDGPPRQRHGGNARPPTGDDRSSAPREGDNADPRRQARDDRPSAPRDGDNADARRPAGGERSSPPRDGDNGDPRRLAHDDRPSAPRDRDNADARRPGGEDRLQPPREGDNADPRRPAREDRPQAPRDADNGDARRPARDERGAATPTPSQLPAPLAKGVVQVPVTFAGGYETDPRDHGRPVVLIAAALGVPSDVFRKAFSGVTPAAGGEQPEAGQVRKNKEALLRVLGPYGISNDQLDTVSNFYRYSHSRGQMWRNTPATATATVRDGVVTEIKVTNPGAGYSSAPTVSIPGVSDFHGTAVPSYNNDLKTNGSLSKIEIAALGAKAGNDVAPK